MFSSHASDHESYHSAQSGTNLPMLRRNNSHRNPTRCNSVSNFFYFIFIWSSTCFRWHTTHHQEPKTAVTASGFAYVEGCWMCSCWTL